VVCYCKHVKEIPTKTRVVILQHPRERDVPINTARIAALCLPNSELCVGVKFGGTSALARAISDPERPPILLYPAPDAVDIEAHPPDSPRTLIVLDGTWWQASKLWKENPELHAIPRYAFRPDAPSDYRIRKEPQEDYVSTIEALSHVLGVLEGDKERMLAMREPFRAMVDAQLAHVAKGGGSRHFTTPRDPSAPPRGPWSRLPRLLREHRQHRQTSLVCIYGEANGWPYGSPERTSEREEIIHWLAHRIDTGETFERVVRTSGPLAFGTSKHCGLGEEQIRAGVSFDDLARDFSAFLRPTDLLCSWGAYAVSVYQRSGGSLTLPHVDIRTASRAYVQPRPPGTGTITEMKALLDSLGTASAENANELRTLGIGRGGVRLGELCAIARTLIG
jgi:DTW domain-containing protein YfiP